MKKDGKFNRIYRRGGVVPGRAAIKVRRGAGPRGGFDFRRLAEPPQGGYGGGFLASCAKAAVALAERHYGGVYQLPVRSNAEAGTGSVADG